MSGFLLLQVDFWELVSTKEPIPLAVMGFLLLFSLLSWSIIFSKWFFFRKARNANRHFLRAFRKGGKLDAIEAVAQQFDAAPLATVFDFGYHEVSRQMTAKGRITNFVALERTLQVGVSEEIAKLERSMNWLATTATVTPFIGLFGTVWGIINAFQALGLRARRACASSLGHRERAGRDRVGSRRRDSRGDFLQSFRAHD